VSDGRRPYPAVDTSRKDLQPIPPRKALDEWLVVVGTDTSGSTSDTYQRRVSNFVEWCESEGILNLNNVDGRDVKEYADRRRPKLNETSMKNELRTVRQFLQFGVALEAIEPALPEKLTHHIPSLSKGDEASDLSLDRDRAHAILDDLEKYHYASRDHALFLLLWDTAARISGIRALDLEDFDEDDGTVRFLSRPGSDTRLKNGQTGERMNVLDTTTVDVLRDYIRKNRKSKTDDFGRSPLITTKFGRPSTSMVRRTTYRLTQPCNRGSCPHGEEIESCQFREHGHASKCPSSLSPHPVRTGRITDLRNRGVRIAKVAGRVDAMPDTIRAYYDKPDLGEDLARRRDTMEAAGL
jgi:site-specific recombinase XerD